MHFSGAISFECGPFHASLSQPHMRTIARRRHRHDGAALGLGAPGPGPWRAALRRSARSLRSYPGRRGPGIAGLQGGRAPAFRMGRPCRRRGPGPPRRDRESRAADRHGRGVRRDDRAPVGGRRTAASGVRRPGLSGRRAPDLPVPRPEARAHAPQHHEARRHHRLDPPPDARPRVLRVPDAHPHGVVAGRGAGLPRAVAPASGQVLCPAAGAAAVQAADHDRRLRPLFPDRAVLPRRGREGRPVARASSTSSTSR